MSKDQRTLTVVFRAPYCGDGTAAPRVTETATYVRIAMIDRFDAGDACEPRTVARVGRIALKSPLAGRTVLGQPPLQAARRLYTRVAPSVSHSRVPRLVGLSPANARFSAAVQLLSVKFVGAGRSGQSAIAQHPAAGTPGRRRLVLTTVASPGSTPAPERHAAAILERDWCDPPRDRRALRVHGLSKLARRGIRGTARFAREHPRGCRLAERVARRGPRQPIPEQFPRSHHTRRGDCPVRPLPLGRDARHAAAIAALAREVRADRPILYATARADRPGVWTSNVRHACGRRVGARTIVVSIDLSAFISSSSLAQRVVAVSRFRHGGWRIWLLLH